jgi:hypothetical protein
MFFFFFSVQLFKAVVRFVDIGGIVDHLCLYFSFLIHDIFLGLYFRVQPWTGATSGTGMVSLSEFTPVFSGQSLLDFQRKR